MLDSLVRVSRRVGWETDRFATDPQSDGGETGTRRRPRLASTASSPCLSNGRREPGVPATAGGFLGPQAGEHRPRAITLRKRSYLPGGLITAQEPVVALSPRKVHSPVDTGNDAAVPKLQAAPPSRAGKLNSAGRLSGPIRLPLYGFTYS